MMKRIAPDKRRHFFAGIIIGFVLEFAGWWFMPDRLPVVTVFVFILVLGISYGFELFSKITGKGRYDFLDAVASVIGGLIGMGAAFLLIVILAPTGKKAENIDLLNQRTNKIERQLMIKNRRNEYESEGCI